MKNKPKKTPDRTAIEYENESITYKELNEKANRLARVLTTYGAKPECVVPLYVERKYWVIAVLAVLKSGAAFVPLDLKNPIERSRYIINEVQATILITTNDLAHHFTELSNVQLISLDDQRLLEVIKQHSNYNGACVDVHSKNLAYVMYTSGTTGNPKGVMIEHYAIVNSIIGHQSVYAQKKSESVIDRCLSVANYCFDVFITDLFVTLCSGDVLCVPSQNTLMNNLTEVIQHHRVTRVELTPTFASLLNPFDVPTIQTLILGGEELFQHVIEKWCGCVQIIQTYGPTETAVSVTVNFVRSKTTSGRNIGKPFGVNKVIVLDDDMELVPLGGIGELCIAGPQLSRGYVNLDDVTRKVLVPCKHLENERIYKTGDLVRLLPTGDIEFLGRKDSQVKVNGVRIELGDIESRIMESTRVAQAAAGVIKINAKNCLVAWVLPRVDGVLSNSKELEVLRMRNEISNAIKAVKSYITKCLPPYMIPSRWIPVNAIPKSTSGKIDRKRLIKLVESVDAMVWMEKTERILPVQTSGEKFLQTIWSEILSLDIIIIGRQSNFIELGGDSVSVIFLVQKCRQEGYELNANQMFNTPILKDMAASMSRRDFTKMKSSIEPFSLLKMVNIDINAVKNSIDSIPPDEIEDIYPASPLQEGMVALTQHDSTQYMLQHVYDLQGEIDINAFR